MDDQRWKNIIEAALLASGRPLTIGQLEQLFVEDESKPSQDDIGECLDILEKECGDRGLELKKIASGYRYQVRQELEPWISRLWEEKPSRYSRALLETLALIIYRQPITRAEIEEIRGVSVSTGIVKTLLERDWVRVLGRKEVPGRPALYGSTTKFLDDFNMKSLNDLPSLAELTNIDQIKPQLDLGEPDPPPATEDTNPPKVAIVTSLPSVNVIKH